MAAGFAAPAAADAVPDWWTASLGGAATQSGSDVTIVDSNGSPAFADAPDGQRGGDFAAMKCLAKAIGYEAGNEPLAGRQAVAQVILNRARHKGFPKSVCGVVFQGSERHTGCQFTFTCDGSMRRQLSRRTWEAALSVARQALAGDLPATVGAATHYHASYVSPRWAPSLVRVAAIGAHIFYRFPGSAGAGSGGVPQPAAPVPVGRPAPFSPWGLPAATTSGS